MNLFMVSGRDAHGLRVGPSGSRRLADGLAAAGLLDDRLAHDRLGFGRRFVFGAVRGAPRKPTRKGQQASSKLSCCSKAITVDAERAAAYQWAPPNDRCGHQEDVDESTYLDFGSERAACARWVVAVTALRRAPEEARAPAGLLARAEVAAVPVRASKSSTTKASPSTSTCSTRCDTAAEQGDLTTYTFAVPSDPMAEPRGPLCLRGTEFTVDTRQGSSDELVIFLQGGGACWEDFCSAFEDDQLATGGGHPQPRASRAIRSRIGMCSTCRTVTARFSRVTSTAFFRTALSRKAARARAGLPTWPPESDRGAGPRLEEFPNPSRILLTGISGGAFGTINALPLVRYYYPETEIVLFNDSGVGVAKDGDPDFVEETLLAGWNAESLIPASCTDCTSNGHVTRLIEWQLAADDNFTMSALSFSADQVISTFFLMIPGDEFTESLLAETGRTTTLYEDRYKRFIPEGGAHTTLLREIRRVGKAVSRSAASTPRLRASRSSIGLRPDRGHRSLGRSGRRRPRIDIDSVECFTQNRTRSTFFWVKHED